MAMEIVIGLPPNIEKIKKTFNLEGKYPVFCYGPYIFNPHNGVLDEPLVIHETTHSIQQEEFGDIDKWWDKYLEDPIFRKEQEIPAYQNQYVAYCRRFKDRNRRARYLNILALNFSSKMYGNIISFSEALKIIKNGN